MDIEVRVLGALEVLVDGVPVRLGGRKQRSVLAVLALSPGHAVAVPRLVDGVWGEAAGDRAGATLQVYVSTLRRLLADAGAPGLLTARAPGYVLDLPPGARDLDRLDAHVAAARAATAADDHDRAARHLRDALALWRGPTLGDLAGEPFAGPEVVRYDELRAALLEDRAEADLAAGRHAELVAELEAATRADPLRERLWGALMLALYRSGRQADALRTFARARSVLADEVGLDPGPALRDLERRILGQDPGLEAPGARRPPVSLPTPATELVGREEEAGEVGRLLEDGARLVTLTGPGGVGKTRLALEVAHRLAAATSHTTAGDAVRQVRFVGLDTVADGDQLLAAVAADLGLGLSGDDPVPSVAAATEGRPTLLVLDNCEQVTGAGAAVGRLLAAATGVAVLATSRAPLRVRGEQERPVEPLALPHAGAGTDAVAAAPAVALFAARARTARPDFRLDASTAGPVTEICTALDGLPLALELAAARLRVLDLTSLAARLDRALSVLTGGAGDLPARHRTLRATLDWSHDLLTPAQQRTLARLGVFRGTFTLASAEEVCGPDVVDDVAALVEGHLVRSRPSDSGLRFVLPGTVRAYAAERLDASPDADRVHAAQATRVERLVQRLVADADGPEAHRCVAELTEELPDIRGVLDRASEHDPRRAARVAAALRFYWLVSGRLTEAREWLDRVVPRLRPGDPEQASTALARGALAYFQDDRDTAERELVRAVEAARAASDPGVEGAATAYRGALLVGQERLDEADALAAEALAIGDRHGLYEPRVLALSLAAVVAASRGDLDAERSLYERRLELVRARGDARRIAETLGNLAEVALADGDVERAGLLAREALDIARQVARLVTRDVLLTLGRVALLTGDPTTARERLREALDLSVDLGQGFETAQCVVALAGVAAAEGDDVRAARLYGAARRMRDAAGVSAVELEPDLEAHRTQVRDRLGGPTYDALASAGAALDAASLLALATAEAQPIR
ncbi:AfsR/SARP family transcriptional regulator [Lapillicoccus jejuensis]|uniref:Putative ATPase n=1 Tax=Lapillicoccus jejuensis TaxID=402171 RepID=A0A542DZA8_9MICO|nr:BTAD domain-containing putative transcriptional regulator [Lapillicoccus jejuensis]TQJ08433.1 putative ATPase [Lapillicoccus jejuensis]